MAWLQLIIAGLFEVVWATSLKYSHGFTRLVPTLITFAGMLISFYFLSQATKILPLGTAYAIWTGIGAVGSVIVGMLIFGEPVAFLRIIFLLCIIAGITGLKFTA